MKRGTTLMAAMLLVVGACGGDGAPDDSTIAATTAVPPTAAPSTSSAPPSSPPPPSGGEPDTTTTTAAPSTTSPTTTLAAAVEITLPEPDATDFAIINATIITATGAPPIADGVVIVEEGRITAVGAAGDVVVPDDMATLDAGGGHVMPGLIDTHTHILDQLVLDGSELDGLRAGLHLETPLKTGLTTFRDVGSEYGAAADLGDLSTAIAGHDGPIPWILLTGPILTRSGSEIDREIPNRTIGVANAEEAAAVTSRLIAEGVDQIHVALDTMFQGRITEFLDAAQMAAITATAHEHRVRVMAHAMTEAEAWVAVDGGVDELAHWPDDQPLSDDLIAALAAADITVMTTFGATPAAPGDLRRMLDAGVKVVMGSDAPISGSSVATWRELDAMVSQGATPMEAILASTRDAAFTVGLLDEIGTIEVGKIADLLILTADPLADVRALQSVEVVIKGGVIVV